jgi:cell division protein ZipA
MEVGLREWLIVGAIIVIILIVVDGWRRMRAQSNSLKIDIDDKLSELGNDEYNPELPLGSARVFKAKDEIDQNDTTNKDVADAETVPKVAIKSIEENFNSNAAENVTAPAPKLANNVALSSNPVNPSSSIQQSQEDVDIQSRESLSAARVSHSSAKAKSRIEPVFEEIAVEADNSAEQDKPIQQVASAAHFEQAIEEPLKAPAQDSLQEPLQDTLQSSSQPDSDDVPSLKREPQLPTVEDLHLSSDDSFVVPDILKKAIEQPINETVDTSDNLAPSQQGSGDNLLESDTSKALDDANLEQEKAAKENIDNIVNNLLTTLAQSKKTAPKSTPDEITIIESHYQERIRKAESNELVTDKFEQLLAEKTANSNLDVNKTEVVTAGALDVTRPEISHFDVNNEEEKSAQIHSDERQASEEPEFSELAVEVTEEQQQESLIEDIEEEESVYSEFANAQGNNSDELDAIAAKQQEIDALKAKLEALSVPEIEEPEPLKEVQQTSIDLAPMESANDTNLELTTVIDDEVELEDLSSEVTKLPVDLDLDSVEEFASENIEQEIELDPLMDGYNDNAASQELVSQFEEDLEEDQQAVANELDMPITEILRKQLANAEPENVAEQIEEDPLLEENQLPESLLSGAHFAMSEEELHVEESQPAAEDQIDEVLDDADNLGFSAVDQDGFSDPLMDNFVDEQEPSIDPSIEIGEQDNAAPAHQQKSFFDEHENKQAPVEESTLVAAEKSNVSPVKARKVISNIDDPNAVLIVTVVAKEHYLNGAALRRVVEACGMEFGDMEVFHRFEDGVDSGAVQFSMANAINPGIFDIELMDETTTPGVSFFMSMDEPADAKKALECMLATAETVALHLHGDLLDDDRSVLRPQTKEHYRERVRIHGMNKLRKRAQ